MVSVWNALSDTILIRTEFANKFQLNALGSMLLEKDAFNVTQDTMLMTNTNA